MKKQQESPFKTDELKVLYTKTKQSLITETEALQNDLTEVFWRWMRNKIKSRELIVIGTRGEVRTGKSTIEIKIVYEINKYITEIGLNTEAVKYIWKWIFSDQTEFLRFINGNDRNVCLAIDEMNTLAKTGINSTTEEALLDYYSDVFAGQYLHRVLSTTDGIIDKNTTIILEVMGKDEERKITRCKLIYRDIITKQTIVIGRIDIDISDIVKNWTEKGIREIVETKGMKTIEEKRIVERYVKEDFYIRYQVKKYRRMDLLKKEGVRDIRELEFSDIILDCIKELEEYSTSTKADRELINTVVDEVVRRHKRIYSLIAKNEISQKVSAILNLNTKKIQLEKKLLNPKLIKQHKILNNTIKKLQDMINNRIKEQEHLQKVYTDYMEIDPIKGERI